MKKDGAPTFCRDGNGQSGIEAVPRWTCNKQVLRSDQGDKTATQVSFYLGYTPSMLPEPLTIDPGERDRSLILPQALGWTSSLCQGCLLGLAPPGLKYRRGSRWKGWCPGQAGGQQGPPSGLRRGPGSQGGHAAPARGRAGPLRPRAGPLRPLAPNQSSVDMAVGEAWPCTFPPAVTPPAAGHTP